MQPETARVVWSWHSQDPTGPDSIPRHEFQGSTSLNLLAERIEREEPPGAQSYTFRVGNVHISACVSPIVPSDEFQANMNLQHAIRNLAMYRLQFLAIKTQRTGALVSGCPKTSETVKFMSTR